MLFGLRKSLRLVGGSRRDLVERVARSRRAREGMTCRLLANDILSYCCAITTHVVKACQLKYHWDEAVEPGFSGTARAAAAGTVGASERRSRKEDQVRLNPLGVMRCPEVYGGVGDGGGLKSDELRRERARAPRARAPRARGRRERPTSYPRASS
jgi:hypothetical protein